jgi:hypothetical protein
MKNEAAAALGRLSAKKSPKTHSKEHMANLSRKVSPEHLANLSRLGVEARRKKREEADKNASL